MKTAIATFGTNAAIQTAKSTVTISSALDLYTAWLLQEIQPANYPRIARAYIDYCTTHKLGLDTFSLASFAAGKSRSIASAVRRFLRWYEEAGRPVFRADPPPPSLPPAYNSLILRFIDEAEGLTSLESRKTYQRILNGFFTWIDQQSEAQAAFLDGRSVKRFLEELNQSGRSSFTLHLYLSCLRSLANWVLAQETSLGLEAEGRLGVQSILRLKLPPLPLNEIFKDGLSGHERQLVLDTLSDPGDRLLYGLMAWGGLRTIEVVRLRWGDIDLETNRLFVTGKGQTVPLPIAIPLPLASLITGYLKANQPDHWLLPNIRSTRTIRRKVRAFFEGAGIRLFRRSAHSLRHTTAEQLMADGIDPHIVQRHLRHQKFDTTKQYTKVQSDVTYFQRITG